MQPGVTVVLATVWLVVSVGVVGAATLNPSHFAFDQYSPLPPYHHEVYQRVQGQLDWKDQDRPEDQPTDLSIGPRRSTLAGDSPARSFGPEYPGKNVIYPRMENDASTNNDFASLGGDKQSQNSAGSKFTDEGAGHRSTKLPESFSREIPAADLEDPFVADDTFQDQGPGSVEIYKLDLVKEKALLNPTPTSKVPLKNKGKTPKKTNRVNWKTKVAEYKTTSPKINHRQSNFFDELRTEVPPNSSESFGVGGVPELQVGCEGLEASAHKLKRSIDVPNKEDDFRPIVDPWLVNVTPITLDLDYDLSSEEVYEEMDELLKLKKLETTTKRSKQNRGDMEATLQSDAFFTGKRNPEKLPVRGDLGKSNVVNESGMPALTSSADDRNGRKEGDLIRSRKDSLYDDSASPRGRKIVNEGRKLLWLEGSSADEHRADKKRLKRASWGFGEDEGAVTSDELQTEHQRRRQEYERKRQEEGRARGYSVNRTNIEIDRIREEYEKILQQREREEEERRRRVQHGESQRTTPERWQEMPQRVVEQRTREQSRNKPEEEDRDRQAREEEMRRRHRWQEEERRRQEIKESRGRYDHRTRNSTEQEIKKQRYQEEEKGRREQQRQDEEERSRRQREEEQRRRQVEDRRRRLQEEEARRSEQIRQQEEMQRKRQEEDLRKRMNETPDRNLPSEDRRSLEERRREWMMKRRQEQEEERRRLERTRHETPSNLLQPFRSSPNDSRRMEPEADRRMREQQERERERQLREYIQRNQPIHVDRSTDRRREGNFDARRAEEDRRRYRPADRQDLDRNSTRRREESEENRGKAEDQRRRQEAERRRQEEERKLQEYIRRNQPVHVMRTNATSQERDSLENRRIINEARQYDRSRYPAVETGRRNHGPSAPINIDPRTYVSEDRRREEARRLEEERRVRERQRQEDEERKKEMRRREEEVRRTQSQRYEEERRRLESVRLDDERMRKELIEEATRRSQAGRPRPLENTRPQHQDRHRFEEQRRRQDTSLVPGNLLSVESRRTTERERQREEQERRRLEAERRRQQDHRMKEARQKEEHARGMNEQWRRQEEARLNALPVSARIIVRSGVSPHSFPPTLTSRGAFGNEIDFPGINPNRQGVEASRFPVAPTRRPPTKGPSPCVWAVVQCCPTNKRLVTCFESMGCPGANWDPSPCRSSVAQAAREEVMKFYASAERDHNL